MELSDLLFSALNEQGYLFQEACLNELRQHESNTQWKVKAYEYGISLGEQDTKADIVLHSTGSSNSELYALVECKRADPSFVYWMFAIDERDIGPRQAGCWTLGLQCHSVSQHLPYQVEPRVMPLKFGFDTFSAFHCMEVKKGEADLDKRTSDPQTIESAFTQVLRGVGGLAQEQLKQRAKVRKVFTTYFIPVVVTTAALYAARYQLSDIDLSTGKISRDSVHSEEWPWMLVHYGVGDNLGGNPIPEEYKGVDITELDKYKTRSIFVVNSRSLIQFFSELHLVA